LIIGQPITINKIFNSAGVDPTTGVYQFRNADGKNINIPNVQTDRTVLTNLSPKFYGGFQNSFSYKGFEIDILFQFSKQQGNNYKFGNRPGLFTSDAFTPASGNQPTYVLDRWQHIGDENNVQKYSSNYPFNLLLPYYYVLNSDAAISDASYIRLKNLSISWNIIKLGKSPNPISNARVYMQGQNLFTITKYLGMDPETKSSVSLPPLKMITIGFQLTLQ